MDVRGITHVSQDGGASFTLGILQFLASHSNKIAGIVAHLPETGDEDNYYALISRGLGMPSYTFLLKGNRYLDFEYLHVRGGVNVQDSALIYLVERIRRQHQKLHIVLDLVPYEVHRCHIQNFSENYRPTLERVKDQFFRTVTYFLGGGFDESILTPGWTAEECEVGVLDFEDARYINFSAFLNNPDHRMRKYDVESLIGSGAFGISDPRHLGYRYRCIATGWGSEKINLAAYDLGLIYKKMFDSSSDLAPSGYLASAVCTHKPIAFIYARGETRLETIPMSWSNEEQTQEQDPLKPWFDLHIEGEKYFSGWSLLGDDPNPFVLYDMKKFWPDLNL